MLLVVARFEYEVSSVMMKVNGKTNLTLKNVEAAAKPSHLGGILTVNDELASLIH